MRAGVRASEDQIVIAEPAEADRKPVFHLCPPVCAQRLDGGGGQANRPATGAGLRRFEAEARGCLFQTALDPYSSAVEVERTPSEPAQFAASCARSQRQRG